MKSILRISEAVSLGIHACILLAENKNGTVNASSIAEDLKASRAHLAKVMQRLVKSGIVLSTRGPSGGFKLKTTPDRISLKQIYESIEGEMPSGECLFSRKVCDRSGCHIGKMLGTINNQLGEYFTQKTVKDFISA